MKFVSGPRQGGPDTFVDRLRGVFTTHVKMPDELTSPPGLAPWAACIEFRGAPKADSGPDLVVPWRTFSWRKEVVRQPAYQQHPIEEVVPKYVFIGILPSRLTTNLHGSPVGVASRPRCRRASTHDNHLGELGLPETFHRLARASTRIGLGPGVDPWSRRKVWARPCWQDIQNARLSTSTRVHP